MSIFTHIDTSAKMCQQYKLYPYACGGTSFSCLAAPDDITTRYLPSKKMFFPKCIANMPRPYITCLFDSLFNFKQHIFSHPYWAYTSVCSYYRNWKKISVPTSCALYGRRRTMFTNDSQFFSAFDNTCIVCTPKIDVFWKIWSEPTSHLMRPPLTSFKGHVP